MNPIRPLLAWVLLAGACQPSATPGALADAGAADAPASANTLDAGERAEEGGLEGDLDSGAAALDGSEGGDASAADRPDLSAPDGPPDALTDPAREAFQARLFGAEEVIQAEIELDEEAWEALTEAPREYVRGNLVIDGVRLDNVALKLKGTRGSFRRIHQKGAFKIDLNRYVEGQQLFGLKKLTFNNMIQDVTKMRERLASLAFARFGIAAPRVGYLQLSVNGANYGLYAHVESVDKVFLRRHFRAGPAGDLGRLYEGNSNADLWLRSLADFELDAGDDPESRALRELIGALDRARPASFVDTLAPVFDLTAMQRFFAAEIVTGHWDGYAQHRNNFHLYQRPTDGRWVFIPWGTDQAWMRTRDPYYGGAARSRLFRTCLSWLPCRLPYLEQVRALTERLESYDWDAEIDRLEALTEIPFNADRKTPTRPQQRIDGIAAMRTWIYQHPQRLRGAIRCTDPADDLDGDLTLECSGDCDEGDPTVYPWAVDRCGDAVDQDCNGFVDDGQACPTCVPVDPPGGGRFLLCHRLEQFHVAWRLCDSMGGMAASIHSQAEQDFVSAAALARRPMRWWIGFVDYPDEGTFRWLDETPVDFTDWRGGEPNNNGGYEDCTNIGSQGSPQWTDSYCGEFLPVICRMP